MGIYFTEESKNSFLENSSKNSVFKDKRKRHFFLPIYIGIGATFFLLCLLCILIPIWLKDLAELEKLVDQEFSGIRVKSESAWRELLQIESDDPTVSWARIRRQTSDEFSNYDYRPDPNTLSNNEAAYDGEGHSNQRQSLYPAEPVSASYNNNNYDNYREQKCCCDLQAIVASGNIDQLPVLSQCRTGVKGPPGQKGPIGEAGYDGRPGRPGLDFSNYAGSQNSFNGPHAASYPADDPYAATMINPYPSPPSSSPRYCEPCPPGRQGPPGGPGRPGNPGTKGVQGSSGKHGLPGRAGNRGPTGDMGPPGRHGYGGTPGPNGADGIKGATGNPGSKGQRGDTGLSGIRGPQGPDGSPGYIGRGGIRGPRGIKGQRGLDGIDGPPGRPGTPGDDGFYCACPPRSSVFVASNDDYNNQNFPPQRPSAAVSSFAQPPRPPPITPSPPSIQPIITIPRPSIYQNRQNPNEYTRKIYINDPTDNIPIAPRREFQTNSNNINRPISTNIHSPFVTQSSPQFDENNNNAFVGRNVFTTNRPLPSRNWQTTTEEQTYGLDEDFINPRKVLHRHHQIA